MLTAHVDRAEWMEGNSTQMDLFYSTAQYRGTEMEIRSVKLVVTKWEISVYVGHDRGHYYIAVRNH